MTRALRRAALLAIGLATIVAGAAHAAEDQIRLGIHPAGERSGFVEITLQPGEAATVRVDIVNAGPSLQARTYAADALTIINGGFGARFETDPRAGASAWLEYEAASLELVSGAVVTRSATASVPPGTPPGDYIAALVVQNEVPVPVGSSGGVQQVVRAAMAVVIDVPGPRLAALSVGAADHAFAAGTSVIGFPVSNDGNVRLRPAASFRLESSGAVVESLDVDLDSFYAGLPGRVEFPLDAPLAPGTYCAQLVLSVDGAPLANSGRDCLEVAAPTSSPGPSVTASPTVVPAGGGAGPQLGALTLPVLVILLILALLLILIVLLGRRRRREPDQSEESMIR